MLDETAHKWLSLNEAAKFFGYANPVSLRYRLRELRRRGKVVDLGVPPPDYRTGKGEAKDKIILFWANPKAVLIRSDAPRNLLIPARGKRAHNSDAK